MEPYLIMKTASVVLAVAALGGLLMAVIGFRGGHPPAWLAMLHGFLAAAGLTLLAYSFFSVRLPRLAAWALLLFVAAAVGGTVLNLGYHLKNRPLPKGLMAGHAVIAAVGLALLLFVAWSSPEG
jgi:uncharacterized membrane protein